jgi:hypothetical protein
MTRKEIEQLAEQQWEGCHGCDENDKNFWINGFLQGYLNARIDNLETNIKTSKEKIADLVIKSINE